MAKKNRTASAEMDMTPMIDVVFNLIIFFMIVSEISKQDLAILVLPSASQAIPDEKPPPERMILNIVNDTQVPGTGRYYISGQEYFIRHQQLNFGNPIPASTSAGAKDIKDILQPYAQRDWDPKLMLSEQFLLVRADKGVFYKYVQAVMQISALLERVHIYKMQIAIKKREPGS
ncbi:MAG: biopolymer transporter ExbD [Planctomycetes bacterium]|nr:biopolymer transporter ExbD [Planctomycetota bacterium]